MRTVSLTVDVPVTHHSLYHINLFSFIQVQRPFIFRSLSLSLVLPRPLCTLSVWSDGYAHLKTTVRLSMSLLTVDETGALVNVYE